MKIKIKFLKYIFNRKGFCDIISVENKFKKLMFSKKYDEIIKIIEHENDKFGIESKNNKSVKINYKHLILFKILKELKISNCDLYKRFLKSSENIFMKDTAHFGRRLL